MSISASERNLGCFERWAGLAKKCSGTIEGIERFAVTFGAAWLAGAALGATGPATDFLVLKLAGAAFGGIGGLFAYLKKAKLPRIQRKMDRIIQNSKDRSKSMLAFSNVGDPRSIRDLMTINNHQVSIYEKIGKTHSIEIMNGTPAEVLNKMASNKKKYDLILIEGGHGIQTEIDLVPGLTVDMDSEEHFEWFDNHIEEGGSIILNACLTAKGVHNIASQFSLYSPKATVYASSTEISGVVGMDLDDESIPRFNNGVCCKGRDTTRVYPRSL